MCGCNRAKQALQNNSRPAAPAAAAPRIGGRGVEKVVVDTSIPTVDTSVWGAALWNAIHIATVFSTNLPLWKEFMVALEKDIPCPDCRGHYSEWLRRHPLRQTSLIPIKRMLRRTEEAPNMVLWFLNLHNDVNLRTGRGSWNEQQLRGRFGGDRNARLVEGRASLESIRGAIGGRAFDLLMRLLG